jgi:RNA polymerase sigma factor (sigma-70 family)
MELANNDFASDGNVPTAECLLGRITEVRRVLRRKGFSENTIECAVTVLYGAAMPYITGTKACEIKNRRAWVFNVAIQAAQRAANREVRLNTLEAATLASTDDNQEPRNDSWDIVSALKQLTKKQSAAVDLCILQGKSQREAAREMGIAVSTLCDRLSAAKNRLKRILAPLMRPGRARL